MIQVVLIGKKKKDLFQIYPLQTLILTDSNLKRSFKNLHKSSTVTLPETNKSPLKMDGW